MPQAERARGVVADALLAHVRAVAKARAEAQAHSRVAVAMASAEAQAQQWRDDPHFAAAMAIVVEGRR